MRADREYVLKTAREHNVKFIRLWFTDILGFLKSFAITVEELGRALEHGIAFDGSSIDGFARVAESDMIAMPDPETFCILPWRPRDEAAVGRMFCDILETDGQPFSGDPRLILKRNLAAAAEKGYSFYVGPELEYFYFNSDQGKPQVLDQGGYFDLTPHDVASDLRRETVLALEEMGIGVEFSHHEAAPSQHEIDLRYTDALTMADNAMTYRLAVKEIAVKHGVFASFMPKPVPGVNGSGMHVNISLFEGDRNLFHGAESPGRLSALGMHFMGGLLHYAPELTLVTNQWINSYKRLIPGYEAPVYLSWALKNRSDLIRIPAVQPGHEEATRLEYRSPDAACNPYLAFAVLLAAGMEGINQEMDPGPPVEENIFEMSKSERERRGIASLPGNLYEAIMLAEKSELLKRTLGEHVFAKLIDNKKQEWEEFSAWVTDFEIRRSLPVL